MTDRFQPVVPGLWMVRSRVSVTNSGVWLEDRAACLIDPGNTTDEVAQIAAFVQEQGGRTTHVVLTHAHWDHALGVQAFPGVPVVAHANYPGEIERDGEVTLRFLVKNELVDAATFAFPRPDLLVYREMALPGQGPALRLIPTPGHSADHLSLYDPRTGALWAGDMLSDMEIPYVISSLADYERTLAHLSTLDVRALVPGHGHPTCDPAEVRRRLRADTEYLAALRAGVEAALHDGRTIGETVARLAGLIAPQPEMEGTHRLNVESAYVELGGPGNPLEVGWGRSFATMAD
jgi:glyoxylase-like metal-dependent hydrolase (beta-lactamase superfamily II)